MVALNTEHIIVTHADLEQLLRVIEQHDTAASESLDSELHRAIVVDSAAIPPDVVTMNSDVVYEDLDTRVRRNVRVVYPKDANAERGWVSVLAPIGSALIGLRAGQSIEWDVPHGRKRVRVVDVRR